MNSRKRESRKRDLIYLAPELRQLVRQTMEVLGQQYVLHFGRPIHKELMQVRSQMADLRHSPHHVQVQVLKRLRARFRKMTPEQRKVLAHGFSLMMEITNVCENAYRAHRLGQRSTKRPMGSGLITWVITAHPTESRSKILLPLLRRLQGELMSSLTQGWVSREESIRSLISVITRSPLAPQQRPRPEEEADYLFASCLHPDNVEALTERDDLSRLFRLKTWVGGDKDGHPGVDEKTLLYSLHRSRRHLLTVIENWLVDWRDTASVHPDYNSAGVDALLRSLHTLERLDPGD
ncbi:MAG: phosphoenolpyruvate carboxylase, partial [Bdellovibrionales bacterium]